ncbi:uncharacterized protein N7469_007475 [Penicillium citrinum]|uniref:Uncharacterized protein n=1 Tax=Penicillium citrinum TaxID=5077 RepID=A0A9W9NZA7_PENCI|nr:uncharacterized protein N7469_007475 [Penicillium citrinum]KAJ5227469.1 hypothetical protein N7469_007475 [Penicillium citrinum]
MRVATDPLSPEGSTASCPDLTPSVRDPQETTCPSASGTFEMSAVIFPTIRMVNKAAYPDAAGLKAKVSLMTQIENSDEEILVRSVHPSLRDCPHVAVIEGAPLDRPVWLITPQNAKFIVSTHAAGREIHVKPSFLVKPVNYQFVPIRDVIVPNINPRSFLSVETIEYIRLAFPGSVGAQVLISGWILVLFPDKKTLQKCWDHGAPDEICNLRVGYILMKYYSTATSTTIIEAGQAVTETPDSIDSQAALGLRLRLPGGLEAITTVTHAFVRLADPQMSSFRRAITEQILVAKKYLQKLRPPPKDTQHEGMVFTYDHSNSPIGKAVWLSGTKTQIGAITLTYDRCSRHHLIPYPHGFQHDLSLITGPNLPQLTNPRNSPRVTVWGPYEEALQGKPVFVHSLNVATNRHRIHEGYGVTTQAQKSIIHGTHYTWEERTRGISTALLWRTLRDTDGVEKASGSILCLGETHHETASALLFQNFQGPLRESEDIQIGPDEDLPTFKGGFLLPKEIRMSTIISVENLFSNSFLTPQKNYNMETATQENSMTV